MPLASPHLQRSACFSTGGSAAACDLHRTQWPDGETHQGAGIKTVAYNPLRNGLNAQSLPTTGISQRECFRFFPDSERRKKPTYPAARFWSET